MARIDRLTQAEYVFPSMILMEDAGVKAWSAVRRVVWASRAPRGRHVFVAGRGNNGGDSFVMARQAAVEGAAPAAIVLAAGRPPADSDPGRMLAMCDTLGIECVDWLEQRDRAAALVAEADWLFDGIAGTGIHGALQRPQSEVVERINASRGRKIALDVPSGIGDEFRAGHPAVRADFTLAMGLPKLCLYLPRTRALCGRILVIPVGFPQALVEDPDIPGELLGPRSWRTLAPYIPPDTHKNKRGHLAVFAGSSGTTGAAWLCATAAARSRVGLVTLFIDPDAYPIVAPKLTSVMCRSWDLTQGRDRGAWDPAPFSGVLVGPGWGLSEDKARWLDVLLSLPVPGVLDADALTLLGRGTTRARADLAGRWVLTPHPGEFARLAGVERDAVLDEPVKYALETSAALNAVIVLKGHCTIVASPAGRFWILDAANPALATAGSGDVLAGIIAAGVAGGLGPVEAALFGVSLHAHVGRIAARRAGWFLAEDLVPLLSRVLWQ